MLDSFWDSKEIRSTMVNTVLLASPLGAFLREPACVGLAGQSGQPVGGEPENFHAREVGINIARVTSFFVIPAS